MTRVFLIRHAEAEGNLYRRIHGHYNSNLTKLGIKQLDALEKRFDGVHIDKVYSSDLRRTIMTSTAITRSRGMNAETTPLLREMGMGQWEDLEWGNAEKYYTEQLILFSTDPAKWTTPDSEFFGDVQDRMIKAVLEKARENPDSTIALFSHGAAIRALTAKLLGIPSDKISTISYCDNTAVMELAVSGESIDIISKSDSSHITKELTRFKRQNWHRSSNGLDISNLRFENAVSDDLSYFNSLVPDCHIVRPDHAFTAYRGDEKIGMIKLDVNGASGVCNIEYCCFVPGWQNNGFLPQLIGKAVSAGRCAGATSLSLKAEDEDTRNKFIHLGFETDADSSLLIMDITKPEAVV